MEDQLKSKKRFSTKGFTSLLLTCCFLVMTVSGVILFLTPRGRDARWTDWTLFGLDKEEWGALHINNSILLLVVVAVHLVLNWSMFSTTTPGVASQCRCTEGETTASSAARFRALLAAIIARTSCLLSSRFVTMTLQGGWSALAAVRS